MKLYIFLVFLSGVLYIHPSEQKTDNRPDTSLSQNLFPVIPNIDILFHTPQSSEPPSPLGRKQSLFSKTSLLPEETFQRFEMQLRLLITYVQAAQKGLGTAKANNLLYETKEEIQQWRKDGKRFTEEQEQHLLSILRNR